MSKRNELRDDIYQRMHGFKTIKRGYRKNGQSEWYYIDPRGAHSVEDMKEIDVPSENAPNPKLNSILADDMQKNPENYYIWRTKKDDKVRENMPSVKVKFLTGMFHQRADIRGRIITVGAGRSRINRIE